MATAPHRKISQVKGPAKKMTSFYLTGQEKEDEKSEDDQAPTLKPKPFKSVVKKVMMVNRAFHLVQRKISRVSSPSQSDDSSRYSREFTPRENTYRMEPNGKFMPEKTKSIMEKILKSRLEGRKYSTTDGKNLCVHLSDDIKVAVRRNAMLDRHKLVCVVYIGQVLGQGVHVASRCLWNAKFDAFSSATFQNDTLFAQASIFAVFVE